MATPVEHRSFSVIAVNTSKTVKQKPCIKSRVCLWKEEVNCVHHYSVLLFHHHIQGFSDWWGKLDWWTFSDRTCGSFLHTIHFLWLCELVAAPVGTKSLTREEVGDVANRHVKSGIGGEVGQQPPVAQYKFPVSRSWRPTVGMSSPPLPCQTSHIGPGFT